MPQAAEVLKFVEGLFQAWGIWLVPIGAFLENSVILDFVFPGVTVIVLSGFVARTTGDGLWLIILLATIGAFLGDNLDYFIGRRSGKILETKPLFAKPISVVEPFLAKHGIWAIFAGRFSGWSRAWVALVSGIVGFSYFKFVVVSAFSAFVWTSVWILVGYLLGGNRDLIAEWMGRLSILAWVSFVILAGYYFRTRLKLILDLTVHTSRKVRGKFLNGFKKDRFNI